MNPIPKRIKIGTIGELLVQLRLLQLNVQAAPALKDTGNDLIAVRGEVFKAIQVKTTIHNKFNLKNLKKYHILALVKLNREFDSIYLDKSRIFLLQKYEVEKESYNISELTDKELSMERVNKLFS